MHFFLLLFLLCALDTLAGKERICLNMIVKDEAHVIAKALASVKEVIDYWVIVDTGSTDGTQKIIQEVLQDVPGELFERPWVNFSHNRNEALQLAKNTCEYILFLDADDQIRFVEGFEMPSLQCDAYEIPWIHGNSVASYLKVQLIKSALPWRWKGVLHEYISCLHPYTTQKLEGASYIYGGNGARSQDPEKYVKAAAILREALREEPDNSRYVFYLAESLRDAGKREEAIAEYERRVALGGWEEEVYWSLLQMALLQERVGRAEEEVIESFYRAHRYRPHRAEPIYYLAEIFNREKKFALAYACIKGFQTIDQPPRADVSFKLDWVEKWGLQMQLSLAAYYLGKQEEFLALCDEMLKQRDLPDHYRKQVLINKGFAYYSGGYRVLWDLSLAAYNRGDFQEAVSLGNQLLDQGILEGEAKKNFTRNLRYYISGIHAFAHANKHWGAAPWEEGYKPSCISLPSRFSRKSHLHICTVISEETPTLEQLRASCAFHGHSLTILGFKEPFSFGKRLRDYKKYIDTLPDHDVVLCIDGYDVLVLADEKTLLERFLALKTPVLFSAESHCHPYPHLAQYFPSTSSKFPYLNAGTFIGYAGALKKVFATFDDVADEVDDQGLMSLYHLYHKGAIALDYESKIFLTLLDVDSADVVMDEVHKKISYIPLESVPCVIHGNSVGKKLYQEIYDHLFKNT